MMEAQYVEKINKKKEIENHFTRLITLTVDRPDIQNELKKLLKEVK